MCKGEPPWPWGSSLAENWHLSEASRAFFNHGVHQKSEDRRRIWGKGVQEKTGQHCGGKLELG